VFGCVGDCEYGVLDGKNATVNHEMIGLAEQMYPNVKWTKEKNWVVDGEGKIWTAGALVRGWICLGSGGAELWGRSCEYGV